MNGTIGAVLVLLVATNPALLSWSVGWRERATTAWRRTLLGAVGAATVVLGVVIVGTEAVLDAIDVSPPTFRLAVSVVVGLAGTRAFLATPVSVSSTPSRGDGATIVAVLHLLAPAPVFAAAAGAADAGIGAALIALAMAAVASAVALIAPRGDTTLGPALVRLVGAGAIVVAVVIGLDAARTV